MQGLILAAGMGKRLKELTHNNTKCMIKVNGVSLIERVLHQLDRLHLSRVIIVIGYQGQKLIDYIKTLSIQTPIYFIDNTIYDKTNNIYSLFLARDYLLKEDTLLLESDIIVEDRVLENLLNDPRETLALVDKYESWMDGTCVKIGENDTIEEFVPGKKFKFEDIPSYYKTVNIYKFSKHFSTTHYVPFLEAYSKALGNNEYYEQVLRVITMLDNPEIKAKKLDGELWYEIDDIQDLDIAESMFNSNTEEKFEGIVSRYGGYWRYPRLLDFAYLVNPYFPPQKMLDEMKASFEKLITQYPSGCKVNSLLAAKNFGIRPEQVVVGNGAAELIKCLVEKNKKTIGIIRPTFEEYPNRYAGQECIVYVPKDKNLEYNEKELITFFDNTDIETLILINPDNPSGNYIKKEGILRLIEWCKFKKIDIILDESFVDFADEENATLIDEKVISKYKNLFIIKSISKSYGVPGLRLGILVSNNIEKIEQMKRDISIWNVNSYAEFYMQIEEKYNVNYKEALSKIKKSREKLREKLLELEEIKVIPSQANYFMIELVNGMTSKEFCQKMLIEENILVKDLSNKITDGRQFVRVAVKNERENEILIDALKRTLKSKEKI